MKKIISICLSVIIILTLVACSGNSQVSDYGREKGQNAIETIDDFLEGRLTAKEASSKLSLMSDMFDSHIEEQKAELGEDEWRSLYYDDYMISHDISMASININLYSSGSSSKSKITDLKKDIAKRIK